jgi:hypothetical protein
MATTFKNFTPNDTATVAKVFHEAIPVTGTILSGTYAENNIKTFAHGMFQSVYDYPYLSSSANKIMDIAAGYSSTSTYSASVASQNSKKINVYNMFCQQLAGYDTTGSIRLIDADGDYNAGGTKMKECIFLNFTRLLSKDEIKKGSFNISVYRSGTNASPSKLETLSDYGADTSYFVNSPAGEYGLLFSSSAATGSSDVLGHVYYQAGVVVLSASVFQQTFGMASLTSSFTSSIVHTMVSGTVDQIANGLRHRITNIQFNNTTTINSKIYFCHLNPGEFNYSSNPTYLSSSKILTKGNNPNNNPVAYFSRIALLNDNNEILAIAATSEVLRKDSSTSLTCRVRIDT